MALIERYVDTDVVGGDGDGTTWANAYLTLALAEAGLETNLDTANDYMIIWCRGVTDDTSAVVVDGWTMSATDYLQIQAAATDKANISGIDTGKYLLTVSNDFALALYDSHVRLIDLQIETADIDANYECPIYAVNTGATNAIWIGNCYVKANLDASFRNRGIRGGDTDVNFTIWNTVVTGVNDDNASCSGMYLLCNTANVYNCTVHQGMEGINGVAGTIAVYNTAVFNITTASADFAGTIGTIDHCASDDNDGTNNVAESGGGQYWPDDFEDAENGDFTLLVGSGLVGNGTDNPEGGSLYSDNMDGDARTSTWDVSADEYTAAGSSFSASISPSASSTPSPSISLSISASESPSASLSPSISLSISASVSPSASLSPSISLSISASVSPSASLSPSISLSISASESPSATPSASISASVSPSPSCPIDCATCEDCYKATFSGLSGTCEIDCSNYNTTYSLQQVGNTCVWEYTSGNLVISLVCVGVNWELKIVNNSVECAVWTAAIADYPDCPPMVEIQDEGGFAILDEGGNAILDEA